MLKNQIHKIFKTTYYYTMNNMSIFKFPLFNFCMGNKYSHNISSTLQRTDTQSIYEPINVNNIKDNKGARMDRIKVGRGPGSGKGKTSARGHKGYKARVGNVNRHYEGGSTPLTRRLPKHGFRNKKGQENFSYVNLSKILYMVDKGRIDATKPITIRELQWSGAVSKVKNGVKLLSRGSDLLKDYPPINLEVSSSSQRAIDELKSNGGSVKVIYRTPTTLNYLTRPWKFIRAPLDPVPTFRKVVRLLHMEEKGATVEFVKPNWMNNIDLKKREALFKKKCDNMKNAELLPEYPVKVIPHMSDNRLRERKPKLYKKINFEKS